VEIWLVLVALLGTDILGNLKELRFGLVVLSTFETCEAPQSVSSDAITRGILSKSIIAK
jgi:hypothetical protein